MSGRRLIRHWDYWGHWHVYRILVDRALNRPLEGLAGLCVLQILFWTAFPAFGSLSPTLDVAEMLAWGQEWQLGYYKHPPLPAWLAEVGRLVTGEPIWGPMLISQLCVALTYLFVFLLGRRLLGARDAFLGTALLTGVFYFSWPTPEFNHNVIQMPLWAAVFYLFSLIADNPKRLIPWLWLGVAAGLGVYMKYSVGILYAVLGLWLLVDRQMRVALISPAPWIGGLVAVAVALPHLLWLVEAEFLPLVYAQNRSAGADTGPWRPLGFLITQWADHLPMLVPLLLALLPWRRITNRQSAEPSVIRFLAIATLAPVMLTVIIAIIAGIGLKDMWGAPMFTTSGLLAVAVLRERLTDTAARRMLCGCFALLIVLPIAYAAQVPVARALDRKPPRNGWPMAEITARLTEVWRNETRAPLEIVGGNIWLAGLVSAGSVDRPSVRFENEAAYSPWISADDLETYGLLLLWFGDARPQTPDGLRSDKDGGIIVPWSGRGDLDIRYAIFKPAGRQ